MTKTGLMKPVLAARHHAPQGGLLPLVGHDWGVKVRAIRFAAAVVAVTILLTPMGASADETIVLTAPFEGGKQCTGVGGGLLIYPPAGPRHVGYGGSLGGNCADNAEAHEGRIALQEVFAVAGKPSLLGNNTAWAGLSSSTRPVATYQFTRHGWVEASAEITNLSADQSFLVCFVQCSCAMEVYPAGFYASLTVSGSEWARVGTLSSFGVSFISPAAHCSNTWPRPPFAEPDAGSVSITGTLSSVTLHLDEYPYE